MGYNVSPEMYDPVLAHSLKYNIAEFSAFKATSFKKQLESFLTENGNILPWNDFKKKAFEVSEDYNKRWLQTEYHQTVATANMAGKWQDFQANKDLYPNLKYVTVGDSRVRAKHQQWDGLVLPIDHPFWDTHIPPNDWGCRCNVIQTDEKVSVNVPNSSAKKEFGNNPGKTGKVFVETPYKDGLNLVEKKKAKSDLNEFLSKENYLINTPNKNVKISLGTDANDFDRNYKVADMVAQKTGLKFIIRKHIEKNKYKNPEYLINSKYLGDRKSIKSLSNMRKVIDDSKKQMLDASVNPNKVPYYIVWDLDKIKNIDLDFLKRTLQRKVTQDRGRSIKGMIFQYKGEVIHLTRDQIVNRDFEDLKLLS